MKIIKVSNPDWKIWWVGRTVECDECGRIVELQKNDDSSALWDCCEYPFERISFKCAICGNKITLNRHS